MATAVRAGRGIVRAGEVGEEIAGRQADRLLGKGTGVAWAPKVCLAKREHLLGPSQSSERQGLGYRPGAAGACAVAGMPVGAGLWEVQWLVKEAIGQNRVFSPKAVPGK